MRTFDDILPPSRRKDGDAPAGLGGKGSLYPSPYPPKFPFVTIIAILLVIGASLGALSYFSSAKIEVTPDTVSAAVQGSFTANESSGNLPYEIITAQKIASQSVQGGGMKMVKSSASGTLTIFNTQAKAQKLIANTRFATASGLIFRIHTAVTVPAGTTAKPGSITAKVYADREGPSYNVAPTSFTIPGFAGTPQANAVYARSSSPMTGGASGSVPTVDATVESETRKALTTALTPDLLASIQAQIPPGYVLLSGATDTSFQELESAPSSTTGMVDIKEQGTITAVIFPNAMLAKAIAASIAGIDYHDEPLKLVSPETLKLAASGGLPEPTAPSFSFVLTGTASLVYTVDVSRTAAMIAGKTRDEAKVALSNYHPGIKSAIMVLRPFWRQKFPQDPASISVTVVNQ